MHILVLGKYPPQQGGVSATTFWAVKDAADSGHTIDVVTTSGALPHCTKCHSFGLDSEFLSQPGVNVSYCDPLPEGACVPEDSAHFSNLLGLGMTTAGCRKPDLIVGWYLQPYGIVASIIGKLLDIPSALVHAGSDIYRLTKYSYIAQAYKVAFALSSSIITHRQQSIIDLLVLLGADKSKFLFPPLSALPSRFGCFHTKLDIDSLVESSVEYFKDNSVADKVSQLIESLNSKPFKMSSGLTIGVYGKVGDSKGSHTLLMALDALSREGYSFRFLSIPVGQDPRIANYFQELSHCVSLQSHTWILPPLMPWRIPEFIQTCDVIVYLEQSFEIPIHSTAQIPREVLAGGKVLFCSESVAAQSGLSGNLVDMKNAVIVKDANDLNLVVSKFKELFAEHSAIDVIGSHGRQYSRYFENNAPGRTLLLELAHHY